MSLSKIYRGEEADAMEAFQFQSFGGDNPPSNKKKGGSDFSPTAAPVVVAPSSADHNKEIEAAFARGRQAGIDSTEKQLATAAQALATAAEELSRLRDSQAKNSSNDMLRLVFAVAEQIIGREVSADPAIVATIIEKALQASVRSDQYRIAVNPADLDMVNQQKPLFLASVSGLKNLSIDGDATITAGGCRVDSELGDVDATIETQLDAIKEALLEAITDVA